LGGLLTLALALALARDHHLGKVFKKVTEG